MEGEVLCFFLPHDEERGVFKVTKWSGEQFVVGDLVGGYYGDNLFPYHLFNKP